MCWNKKIRFHRTSIFVEKFILTFPSFIFYTYYYSFMKKKREKIFYFDGSSFSFFWLFFCTAPYWRAQLPKSLFFKKTAAKLYNCYYLRKKLVKKVLNRIFSTSTTWDGWKTQLATHVCCADALLLLRIK